MKTSFENDELIKELAKIKNCELLTTEKDYLRIKKSLRKNVSFL